MTPLTLRMMSMQALFVGTQAPCRIALTMLRKLTSLSICLVWHPEAGGIGTRQCRESTGIVYGIQHTAASLVYNVRLIIVVTETHFVGQDQVADTPARTRKRDTG
ncbi:unnamed protein product [Laminaria digitata]